VSWAACGGAPAPPSDQQDQQAGTEQASVPAAPHRPSLQQHRLCTHAPAGVTTYIMQPSGWPQPHQPSNAQPSQPSQPNQQAGLPNPAFHLGWANPANMTPMNPVQQATQFNLANIGLLLAPGAGLNLPWASPAPDGQALYTANFLPGTTIPLPGTQLPGTQQLPNLAGMCAAPTAPAPVPTAPEPSMNRCAGKLAGCRA